MLTPDVGMGETWIVSKATLAKMKEKLLRRFSLGWSVRSGLFAGENCPVRRLAIHVRDICGSLVEVLSGDRVEFIHATARL
jgi:hypothetical protein